MHSADAFFVLRASRLPLLEVQQLRARSLDGEVRDALAAAAPELAAAATAPGPSAREEASLTRYLARMSGRATPRGLLAGVSTGRIGTNARLRLGEARPVSRLSAAAAAAVAARLEADPLLRALVPYRPNPTIYEAERDRLHYLEDRGADVYASSAVSGTPELAATLERARGGVPLPQLAQALVEDGVRPQDAAHFVDELARARLLVSELQTPACGPEPGRHLLERVRTLAPGSVLERDLDALHRAIAAADSAAPGEREAALERAREPAERLGLSWVPREVVHVDLWWDAPGLTLPREVATTLLAGLDVLRRLERASEPRDLERFRDSFRDRYAERRVPLLEALDPDAGIGFGLDAAVPAPAPDGVPWGPPEQLMVRLIAEATGRGVREVDLDTALASLQERDPVPLPDSFAIMATLSAESEEAVETGDYQVRLTGAFGPSAVRLFGRFCHLDPELRRHAESHLRAEESLHPQAVFAEIAHVPAATLGDLVSRPALRLSEIALLGGHVGTASAIEPRDLSLALEDGELVLRDGAGRRVIPRLTNAHEIFGDKGLGLYRFLAQLQFQGLPAGLSWSWGPLGQAPFVPRVRVGKVVLSLACWRISEPELRLLRQGDAASRMAAVTAWRDRVGCPRLVGLPAQESALPLDLEDPTCVEVLLREAPPGSGVTVQERWPPEDRSPVRGPGGRYAHELLIPFISTREPSYDEVRPRRSAPTERVRPPGSDWLFAKLYTAPAYADALIAQELAPLAESAVAGGTVASWHFVRYADPGFHLRLRMQGDARTLHEHVLPRVTELAQRLVDARRVHRVALDTYEREVERYGGDDGILLAERVFHHDSEAVAALLRAVPQGEEPSRERWHLAAAGVWTLLAALGLDEQGATAVARRMRSSFALQQGLDREGVRQLARGLRTARPAIEALLSAPPQPLLDRDAKLRDIGERLGRLEREGRLSRSRASIAGDLAHMHCNRLLRASPRPQELRIHDALERIAAGRAARERGREAVP